MLINFSNHPSSKWEENQLKAAAIYGKISDLPFPDVDPIHSEADLDNMAEKYYRQISNSLNGNSVNAVHIMGELTLTFRLVQLLKNKKITCIASTSSRKVKAINNYKVSYFKFVKFREY